MSCRTAKMERTTRETQISIDLNIDGSGRFKVESDDQFLKHMIETLARYSGMDITMSATGDNLHHLVEDVAITLGKTFAKALDGSPIERMATSTVVMDDALVMTSLDIVDRPYCETDCPDPMYIHFFRSFAMSAAISLHIVKFRGFDEHHIIEASFKSLGMALKAAVKRRETELSTKDRVREE
ncbi:MAG: imidazoleglycerol-phosphate dehydratase [Candidatus Methanomethylophilaceae archaeon]|nr:imidazoleglycerol-phosphate dehydratase [Candidatus Methanomethylophilaceae archaeon]